MFSTFASKIMGILSPFQHPPPPLHLTTPAAAPAAALFYSSTLPSPITPPPSSSHPRPSPTIPPASLPPSPSPPLPPSAAATQPPPPPPPPTSPSDLLAIDASYWANITDTFLLSHDKTTWGFSVAFVVFVMSELGPELAFSICMLQMFVQMYLIRCYPAFYRKNRDWVCGSVRCWRIYMVYRLSSRGYAGAVSSVSSGVAAVVLRQLLVASGALINLVVAVGYQLKFSTHVKMQVIATLASLAGGTSNVVAALERDPGTKEAVQKLGTHLSGVCSLLFEGLASASGSASVCRPPPALAVTLLAQIYVGFLAPTYILYILESTTKRRFIAEAIGYLPQEPSAADLAVPSARPHALPAEPLLGRMVGLLLHALSLLVLLCTCWEVICFALCIKHQA